MSSVVLSFSTAGFHARVSAPKRATLAWLEEFLSPWFAVGSDSTAPVDAVIEVHEAGAGASAATVAGAMPKSCFILDRHPIALPVTRLDRDRLLAIDADSAARYLVCRAAGAPLRIEIAAADDDLGARQPLLRVVRELALGCAWRADGLVLHAAALEHRGQAVLIAGPKRAGKTSLLLYGLGAEGARLIANDRTAVRLGAAADLVARGIPTIVAIRPGSFEVLPHLRERFTQTGRHWRYTIAECEGRPPRVAGPEQSVDVSPAQLAAALGVTATAEGAAKVLLLPRVDLAASGMVLRRLSQQRAIERLSEVMFAASSPTRVSEVFSLPGDASACDPSAVWQQAVVRLQTYECILGRDAFTPPAEQFLAQLGALRSGTSRFATDLNEFHL